MPHTVMSLEEHTPLTQTRTTRARINLVHRKSSHKHVTLTLTRITQRITTEDAATLRWRRGGLALLRWSRPRLISCRLLLSLFSLFSCRASHWSCVCLCSHFLDLCEDSHPRRIRCAQAGRWARWAPWRRRRLLLSSTRRAASCTAAAAAISALLRLVVRDEAVPLAAVRLIVKHKHGALYQHAALHAG